MSNADVRGRFVWHELLTTDTAAAAAFYPKVVPWRTQPSNMPGYTIFMAGGLQVGGLMALPADSGAAHWLMYVGTASVDATVAQAQGLGARVCKEASDIPNVGRFAVLADPQGATFAVFTPAGGPAPQTPPQGAFSWHELQTTDVGGALHFYGELFGWTKGASHDMGAMGTYQLFEHGGAGVGGMCNTQGPSTPPSWLSYVHVADAARTVAAAKSAGGRLLHGPVEVPGGSWIALFLDPQGGAFAVQEAPRAASAPKPAARPRAAAAAKPAAAAAASAAPKKAALKVAAKKVVRRKKAAKRRVARKVARKVRRTARPVRRVTRKVRRAARKSAVRRGVKRRAARRTARRAKRVVRRVKRVVRRTVRRRRR
jgi:predicted enzyme related to lactoylglutathione lyase